MFKQSSRLNIVNFFFSAILNRYKKPFFSDTFFKTIRE